MTRIDFYVLEASDQSELGKLACRLTEKALATGSRVYIACRDEDQTEQLDTNLWDFRHTSFIPHSREHDDEAVPVTLGAGSPPLHHHDLLINLSNKLLDGYARFERILELVPADHQSRAASRELFSHYRDRGYPLQTHRIE